MSGRLEFEPHRMRKFAGMLDHHAGDALKIVQHVQHSGSLGALPPDFLAREIRPGLANVVQMTNSRGGKLMEMANFIRARAILAVQADQINEALVPGTINRALPKNSNSVLKGIVKGLDAQANRMEREFIDGTWRDRAMKRGTLLGGIGRRQRGPLGKAPSWGKVSALAKKLGKISGVAGRVDRGVKIAGAIINAKSGRERATAISGIFGETLGGRAGVAVAVAAATFFGAPPLVVGAAVIGAAYLGGMGGKALGRFLGDKVIAPIAKGIQNAGGALVGFGDDIIHGRFP